MAQVAITDGRRCSSGCLHVSGSQARPCWAALVRQADAQQRCRCGVYAVATWWPKLVVVVGSFVAQQDDVESCMGVPRHRMRTWHVDLPHLLLSITQSQLLGHVVQLGNVSEWHVPRRCLALATTTAEQRWRHKSSRGSFPDWWTGRCAAVTGVRYHSQHAGRLPFKARL